MKTIEIKGSKRESVGKKATKALRNAEQVPCVLYGSVGEVVHFSASEKAFSKLVYTPNVYTVTLDLDGEKIICIMQDIQFHPVTDKILHIDFYKLADDKPITLEIPVELIGTAPGVILGGSLRFPKRKLKVKALLSHLPDTVNADISSLEIGHKLYVSQIALEHCEILHPANTVVAQVRMSRAARSASQEQEEEAAK